MIPRAKSGRGIPVRGRLEPEEAIDVVDNGEPVPEEMPPEEMPPEDAPPEDAEEMPTEDVPPEDGDGVPPEGAPEDVPPEEDEVPPDAMMTKKKKPRADIVDMFLMKGGR